ncbi:hypothetical protein JZU46_05320 [bacterium]|nr:hypothetical protein [bacterium]
MANIGIRKSNFTVYNGYFYTFDEDRDALLQKTDDGNNAFSYPCDVLLNNQVLSLEFDGVYFWSMESSGVSPNIILYIKRWKIDNYIAKLKQTITYVSNSSHIYNSNCFTIEHYHTTLSTAVTMGNTTIYITDYSNNPKVMTDAILHLGPNADGKEEDVIVTGTVFGGVTISTPALFNHAINAEVNFHKRIWLFNNNNGNDLTTGALYKFDSHTGDYMNKYAGGAYQSITACTFYKISSFQALGPKDMLMFAKGSNTLFVNVEEDKKTLYDAYTVNDAFTGTNGAVPNNAFWTVAAGSPTIQSNKLYMSVASSPAESAIKSIYYISKDFDVCVDGNLSSYNATYSGTGYMENSIELLFPNEQNRFCKLSRGYSTSFGTNLKQNFSVITRKATDTVFVTASGTEADPSTNIDIYSLRLRRVGSDVNFYYRTTTSGTYTAWNYLGYTQMFDSDAQLILSSYNNTGSPIINTFDNLTYTLSSIAYISAAAELPYYGSMVMDNVQVDGYTIIPLEDMAIDRNNMYRLQGTNPYNYALSPLESFVTSISLSASPAIIAANGLSTTDIKAWVKDQFLQPIKYRRVTFTENGDGSITGGTDINTDANGYAQTIYKAGVTAQAVIVTATVQQTN